jgi:hypothetical protein
MPIRSRPELRPVSEESYSLRLTLDATFKSELDQLRQLLSHKVPSGDLAAVLREAVRCAIEKHGKRRGAVAPGRKVASSRREGGVPLPTTGTSSATGPREREGERRDSDERGRGGLRREQASEPGPTERPALAGALEAGHSLRRSPRGLGA